MSEGVLRPTSLPGILELCHPALLTPNTDKKEDTKRQAITGHPVQRKDRGQGFQAQPSFYTTDGGL